MMGHVGGIWGFLTSLKSSAKSRTFVLFVISADSQKEPSNLEKVQNSSAFKEAAGVKTRLNGTMAIVWIISAIVATNLNC